MKNIFLVVLVGAFFPSSAFAAWATPQESIPVIIEVLDKFMSLVPAEDQQEDSLYRAMFEVRNQISQPLLPLKSAAGLALPGLSEGALKARLPRGFSEYDVIKLYQTILNPESETFEGRMDGKSYCLFGNPRTKLYFGTSVLDIGGTPCTRLGFFKKNSFGNLQPMAKSMRSILTIDGRKFFLPGCAFYKTERKICIGETFFLQQVRGQGAKIFTDNGEVHKGTWGNTDRGIWSLIGEGTIINQGRTVLKGIWGRKDDGKWSLTGEGTIVFPDRTVEKGKWGRTDHGAWHLTGEGTIIRPDGTVEEVIWGCTDDGE